ncbi:unnamed protein product [Lactuca saligna]|uniref:Uncharacterized protein n=1 Tax=Lactuca saligna TaxID=75948 RepID=A0AA35VFU9_LACSI|nr:unnamed protein product [Lactuca saligna]
MDTNIVNCETILTLFPESTIVILPKGPITKSNVEEVRSSNIHAILSNKESNVNMGRNPSTSIPDSSIVLPLPSSQQPTLIILHTTIPLNSPTFKGILTQHIVALFSSQSIDQDIMNIEEDERIEFAELDSGPEEEDVEDHAIMFRKQ